MIVKSFSPIQAGTTYIDPNSSSFNGTEYFFSDEYPKIYCLITRQNGDEYILSGSTYVRNYYLLAYLKLEGYNNNTDYDYRIDLDKYIYTPHYNVKVNQIVSGGTFYSFTLPENFSNFNIMFNRSDFMSQTGFTQYVNTLPDGVMYITEANKVAADNYCLEHLSLKVIDNVMDIPSYPVVSELHENSMFMIGLSNNSIPSPSVAPLETIYMETSSTGSTWKVSTLRGDNITWNVTGAVTLTVTGNTPTFDFSTPGQKNITITGRNITRFEATVLDNLKLSKLIVSGAPFLTRLDCGGNLLTSLDVTSNTNLTRLDCYQNQLTSLNIKNNTLLTYLGCHINQITSLDITKNTLLITLSCYQNQISSLDVTKNIVLNYLSCHNNKLTSLDVTKNILLYSLQCQINQITSLDVTKNILMTTLFCYSNKIPSLDVTKNTELVYLYCYGNLLTSLNINYNTKLQYLYCDINKITSINTDNNLELKQLSCSGNEITTLSIINNSGLTYLKINNNKLSGSTINTILDNLIVFNKTGNYFNSTSQSPIAYASCAKVTQLDAIWGTVLADCT